MTIPTIINKAQESVRIPRDCLREGKQQILVKQEENPVEYLRSMFPQHKRQIRKLPSSGPSSVEATEGYTMEVVRAVRNKDVAELRRMIIESNRSFDACNSNGEYLLHLACRRGDAELVRFLVQEAGTRADVRDNMGRTALHDACWKSVPDTTMMDVLIRAVSPEMLLMEDIRGHTPFDYAPKKHRGVWMEFLRERRDIIQRRVKISSL